MTVEPSDGDVSRFRTVIAEKLGLSLPNEDDESLRGLLRQRAASCASVSAYLERVGHGGPHALGEMGRLASELTVSETYFLRHSQQFHALMKISLPERMRARSARRRLDLVSLGCATGEEPYTMAILLSEQGLGDGWDVRIRGLDVDRAALARAVKGRYSEWSLRETPQPLRARYFRAEGRHVALDADIVSKVEFAEDNVLSPHGALARLEDIDVIFCRNLLMYLTERAALTVVKRIAHSLAPGGFLFLGHAETLRGLSDDFDLRHSHDTFYYQLRTPAPLRFTGASASGSDRPWSDAVLASTERLRRLSTRLESGKEKASAGPPSWDFDVALELLAEARFTELDDWLRKVRPGESAYREALLLRAVVLTNGGNLATAESICKDLLRLDATHAGAHYLLALCLEQGGDLHRALEHARTATDLDPCFAMPRLHLGLLARKMLDTGDARRELAHALILLERESRARIVLFGGGFTREALLSFCRAHLASLGAAP